MIIRLIARSFFCLVLGTGAAWSTDTCHNVKTGVPCMVATGAQVYKFSQQELHIEFKNTCSVKVRFHVVSHSDTGNVYNDDYDVAPGKSKWVQCVWPGKVAQPCIDQTMSTCNSDPAPDKFFPKPSRLPPPPPSPEGSEANSIEANCVASAKGCQQLCRTFFVNDTPKTLQCMNDDGCYGKIAECKASGGDWSNPTMLVEAMNRGSRTPVDDVREGEETGQVRPPQTTHAAVCKRCETGSARCGMRGVQSCHYITVDGSQYELCPMFNYSNTVSCHPPEFTLRW